MHARELMKVTSIAALLAALGMSPTLAQGTFFSTPPAAKKPQPAQPAKKDEPAKPPVQQKATPPQPAVPSGPPPIVSKPVKAGKPASGKQSAGSIIGRPASYLNGGALNIGGKKIELAGVAAITFGPVTDQSFLGWVDKNGGTIHCRPTARAYQCQTATGLDVGLAMIVNGAAEATSSAPASYRDATLAAKQGAAARDSRHTPDWVAFVAGSSKLTCQSHFTSCGLREYFSGGDTMRSLYANQQWMDLASNVLRINFKMDINYFYLGRSAEALGAYGAAGAYYNEALKLASSEEREDRCSTHLSEWCSGVDLPSELPRHIERMKDMERYQFE